MPSNTQRRLLVELLADELDGDGSLLLGDSGREVAFEELLESGMVSRTGTWVVLTRAGRELACRLADHMLGARQSLQSSA